jgi:hypothetical protein
MPYPFRIDILCWVAEYILAKVSQLPAWGDGCKASFVRDKIVVPTMQNQALPD